MNILLLGSGGREHALAWKIIQSPHCHQLYIAPGNAGTIECGTNVPIAATDFEAIKKCVVEKSIGMVVVGPEDPLVKGIWDFFRKDETLKQIPVIGPSQAGAQLEGSKDFSKQFMKRHQIPTARYKTFTPATLKEGKAFLKTLQPPYVLKADGLAAGKGVVIPETLAEAEAELEAMLSGKFGAASSQVVVEEFLKGIELSVFVLTDGTTYKILPEAKDYKRIGDGDTGLNTGGMGAVSPVPFAGPEFMTKVEERVVIPTVEGLRKEKIEYRGFIFIGLMAIPAADGSYDPYVIEYNVRLGDPETEVVIPRIKSDLVELFKAVIGGTLSKLPLKTDPRSALAVMAVSGGYPGDYEKGKAISGLGLPHEALLFHAGTTLHDDRIKTSGGRVLAITSFGTDIAAAREKSYAEMDKIRFDGMYFRKDIGKDLLAFEKKRE